MFKYIFLFFDNLVGVLFLLFGLNCVVKMSMYLSSHKMVFLKYCKVQISNELSWLNIFLVCS